MTLSSSLEYQSKILDSSWPYSSFLDRWLFSNDAGGAASRLIYRSSVDRWNFPKLSPGDQSEHSAEKWLLMLFLSTLRTSTQSIFLLILLRTQARFFFCCFHRSLFTTVSLSIGGAIKCLTNTLVWCISHFPSPSCTSIASANFCFLPFHHIRMCPVCLSSWFQNQVSSQLSSGNFCIIFLYKFFFESWEKWAENRIVIIR